MKIMDETTEELNPETQPSGEPANTDSTDNTNTDTSTEDSAEEETPEKKGLFGRKKKPKEKKEKKEKPKKEKAPKPKKEKKPKPKKEPKPPKTDNKDAKKSGGITVLLIPLAMLIVGGAVGAFLGSRMSMANRVPVGQELEDTENPDESDEESAEEEESSEPKPFVGPKLPAVMREPMDPANLTMTRKEAADYLLSISPAALGLEGDTMAGYDILPTGSLTPVDGLMCTEVRVYTRNNAAGTAQFLGMYLVSQSSPHRVYKLDPNTREISEVNRYG